MLQKKSQKKLIKSIDTIEQDILKYNTTLIVVDSLASIVRKEFSGSDSSTLNDRGMFLSKISQRLKTIAEFLDVSVVLINQIAATTFKSSPSELCDPSNEIDESGVMPALGSSWTHYVNIRIILQFNDDERREVSLI